MTSAVINNNMFAILFISASKPYLRLGYINDNTIFFNTIELQISTDNVANIKIAAYMNNKFVMVWRDSSESNAAVVAIFEWTKYVGVVLDTVAATHTRLMQYDGVISGMSDLDVGSDYFIDYINGTISLVGDKRIGKAISETELLLESG